MALKRTVIDGDSALVGGHVHTITHQKTPVSFRYVADTRRLEMKLGGVTVYLTPAETTQVRAFIMEEVKG